MIELSNDSQPVVQLDAPKHIIIKQVHGNLSPDVIQITVDRLALILHRHASSLERRRAWIAPAGILLSIVATLLTAEFKGRFLSASTWQAVFIISAILTSVWLSRELAAAFFAPSIDDLIEKIKKQED